MRLVSYLLTFLFSITLLYGQANKPTAPWSELLSRNDIDRIFNDNIKKEFNINYHIFKAFKCDDRSGTFYIVLTEKVDSITPKNDTVHYKIRALNLLSTKAGLIKLWEINDFTVNRADAEDNEYSIWFWTKFSEFMDIDKDGLIDPVVIYGTAGLNGYDDGRIKILVFYKGQKIAIRHQGSSLDNERHTQVDQAFYSLPLSIQNNVKGQMQKIADKKLAIFPAGWQEAMRKHQLKFGGR